MRTKDCDYDFTCFWQGDKTKHGQKVCSSCIHNRQKQVAASKSKLDEANEQIAHLKRALNESETTTNRYKVYWTEEMTEKHDLQDKVVNLEIRIRYAEHIKDRWMAQAKKRNNRIKALKDELAAGTVFDKLLGFIDLDRIWR
jgi:chromosome segregation ATPase